jgi:hypothetical protein
MDHEMQLYVHNIPIQQLVLGANGNFNAPEAV